MIGTGVCVTTRRKATGMADVVKGPRSYFPSIEKTYGQPVEHWMTLLDAVKDAKHMEQVAFLKEQHGMGHGHANAVVAVYRAEHDG
jgi:hypothetical protein